MFRKSKFLTNSNKSSEYIHKDILIKLFSDVINDKTTKLSANDVQCCDVVDKWNEMMDVISRGRKKQFLA